jgi:hypothetical protein
MATFTCLPRHLAQPALIFSFTTTMAALAQGSESAKVDPPSGTRLELKLGRLFVPKGYAAKEGKVRVVVHLHGLPEVVERELLASQTEGVLVTVNLKSLSNAYRDQFQDRHALDRILKETTARLQELKIVPQPVIERVTVTSFSAGFGGVREMLKFEETYQRIDALILADSLYCGYAKGQDPPQVDPKLMEGFLRFAKDARDGKKTLVISHCQLKPEGFASTEETADYLLASLGLKREAADEKWAEGWRCTSLCRAKGFQLFGFEGKIGKDHMQHLVHLRKLLKDAR